MRWKLLLIASLVAAIISAGTGLAITFGLLGSAKEILTPSPLVAGVLLIPVLVIVLMSIFVYRHTSRRRGFQAIAAAVLALLLALAISAAGSILMAKRRPPLKSSSIHSESPDKVSYGTA